MAVNSNKKSNQSGSWKANSSHPGQIYKKRNDSNYAPFYRKYGRESPHSILDSGVLQELFSITAKEHLVKTSLMRCMETFNYAPLRMSLDFRGEQGFPLVGKWG